MKQLTKQLKRIKTDSIASKVTCSKVLESPAEIYCEFVMTIADNFCRISVEKFSWNCFTQEICATVNDEARNSQTPA